MRLPAESLRSRLEQVVGSSAVLTDPERLLVYESDALGRFHQIPRAVVLPRDTTEASEVVRILAAESIPIVPRGAGTGLSGGAVAHPDAVILGTARMNRILDFEPAARRARVQSGVLNSQLSTLAAPHGLTYAPDPSSQTACTLGGNVAENSGGPHCLKYGVTRRYVTGLTLVSGQGEVIELGGDRLGPVEGLDLIGPVVGSEGCFGLVTEIELRLVPVSEAVRTLLAVFPDTAAAGEAVTAIISDGLLPAALEIIDRHTIEAVEASAYAAGYPVGAGAALVVEFDGPERVLGDRIDRSERHCREAGATQLRRAEDPDMRTRLWQGRKKAFGTMGRLAPDLMVQDATVPRSVLPTVLRAIDRVAERTSLRIANVFHAGDGNLHPNILYDRRDEELTRRVEEASREIMKICVDAGGTITGEHGVGLDKRAYLPMVAGPAEIEAMRTVRDAYDPDRRWNPGKVLPDPPERPEALAGAASPTPGVEPGPTTVEGADALADVVRRAGVAGARLSQDWLGPVAGRRPVRYTSRRSIEFSPPDMSLRTPTDLSWSEVAGAAAGAGQWIPLMADPAAPVMAALRPGATGAFVSSFGALRESILGLEVVTGSGQVLRLGGRVVKNVAGFDLVALFAEGALGWITEVTFRTYPLPERIEAIRIPRGVEHSGVSVEPGWNGRGLGPIPGWPDPQVRHEEGTDLLRLGDEAGPAPDGSVVRATGFEALDLFGQCHETGGAIRLELRPPAGGPVPTAQEVASGLGAELAGWVADPVAGTLRVGVDAESIDQAAASAIADELARNGTGLVVLSGPEDLRHAIRDAVLGRHPDRAGARRIADRIRAAFDPSGILLDPSRRPLQRKKGEA